MNSLRCHEFELALNSLKNRPSFLEQFSSQSGALIVASFYADLNFKDESLLVIID
jgi:hypothetical protein